VHRDLAARNVLVGVDGLSTVKLSDVGLSRTLASSDYYRKTSNMKVPIKWMAPESIFERLYTSASDVWSYGVLCWEVYSLGLAPYHGQSADQLISMLMRGERLMQPELCPSPVFVNMFVYFRVLRRLQVWSDAAVLGA
jgi:proto-oncogene tyrosine-protein kinase Ret